jgi:hypothetical protein
LTSAYSRSVVASVSGGNASSPNVSMICFVNLYCEEF